MAAEKFPLITVFGRTLHFISIEFEKELKQKNVDISIGDFVTLYRLSTIESDTITQQNFATLVGKHKSVILRQIDGLEQKNLVARLSDPNDKRKNMISLTKHGIKTLQKVLEIETGIMKKLTSGIAKADIETMKETAFKIQENALNLRLKKKKANK